MSRRKRVYIANTGGTIGMRLAAKGYMPSNGFLAEQMQQIEALQHAQMPAYEIHEHDPLLDSAYMTPEDWHRIALDIEAHYDDFDGFVVIHGTDTMAYTASALAYMLEGLAKPVILTGSQIPLCEVRTDARQNLISALHIAAHQPIPEVCVCFAGRLLRGCRSIKVDAGAFMAFDSPGMPPLGRVGVELRIDWRRVRAKPVAGTPLSVAALGEPMVGSLRLFPGITAGAIRHALSPPLRGLILEAYGLGTGPSADAAFLAAIEEATQRGVVVSATSQCLRGRVDLGGYEASAGLRAAGVTSAGDMTTESALAKLYYLLARGESPERARTLMAENLRGELSVDES